MKLFRTANKDIIDECRSFCNFPLPTEMLEIKNVFLFVVIVTLLYTVVKIVKIVRSYHCMSDVPIFFLSFISSIPFVVNKNVHYLRV